MRARGWQGVVRTKKVRTTVAVPTADRAPDLVQRGFRVPAPNQLLVADFPVPGSRPSAYRLSAGAMRMPFRRTAWATQSRPHVGPWPDEVSI